MKVQDVEMSEDPEDDWGLLGCVINTVVVGFWLSVVVLCIAIGAYIIIGS